MSNEIFASGLTPGQWAYTVVRKGALAWKPGSGIFDAYSTTRGDFVYSGQVVDANGDYGPYDLPDTGPDRRWYILLGTQAAEAHDDISIREGFEHSDINLDQAVPDSNTIGECLAAARAQGFGRWLLDGTTRVLTLYGADGTTPVATFDVGPDLVSPLTRTPQ